MVSPRVIPAEAGIQVSPVRRFNYAFASLNCVSSPVR
jgi:hypothetical protein